MRESIVNQASRKRRIVALLMDHGLITFFLVLLSLLLLGDSLFNEKESSINAGIVLVIVLLGCMLYFAKDCYKGRSIGKWIMGIKVSDEENADQVPSFGRLFLRNLFLIVWPIEFLVLATSKQKKRLGDRVAKTVVLKYPSEGSKMLRIVVLISLMVLFVVFVFITIASTMKKSEAYKITTTEIEQNEYLMNEIGTVVNYGMFPTGNISVTNGYGQALVEIKVIGEKKTVQVVAYLEKEPTGVWQLIEMQKDDGTKLYVLPSHSEL